MADSFFGFDTSVSNINDDDGGGGDGSEDEYDALNDETFGTAGDFDWEVEHEHLAEQLESSRRHKSCLDDSQSQLEASLSQLVLDEIDPALISSLTSSVWRHDPPPPPPQQQQQHHLSAGPMLKSVHTVEELERQLRQGPPQHNQNFFQPRFPPVILQRPPGLQAPVPPPYAPPMMGQLPFQYQMGPPPNMPNHMMGSLNQSMGSIGGQLVANGSQFGQYGLGQRGPPPGLGMPRQGFAPGVGPFNSGYRPQSKPMPEPQMTQQTMGQQTMNQQTMNQQTLNQQTMNQQTMNQQTMNQQTLNQQTMNQQTMNQQTMNQLISPLMQQMEPQPKPQPPMQTPNHMKQKPRVVYNSANQNQSQKVTSENLVHYIQNTHPMLQMNVGNSLNNANHHPMLNRSGYKAPNQFANQRMNGNFFNGRQPNGIDGASNGAVDEYAGLMTPREKQWLVNIQMLQLNTGTPYIDDFYYTVFLERKSKKEKENVKEAHTANQRNHPFYSGGVKQEQHRERHNSIRHNSQSEENPPRASYVPTQFENSLGKLQCGSVTAPRKIIDVELVQGDAPGTRPSSVASTTNPAEYPREVRRTKQLLLDIESLYPLLLRLEEMNDPLAISNALILKEREEKAAQQEAYAQQPPEDNVFLRSVEAVRRRAEPRPDVVDKRQVVVLSAGPAAAACGAVNLLDEDRARLLARLFTGVLRDDRAQAFLACRKGKHLLARLLSLEPSHARARAVWSRVLRALPAAARRDDGALAALWPAFDAYIHSSVGWSATTDASAHLAEAVDPARPPHALTTPLTLSCVCSLVAKAASLSGAPDAAHSERQWSRFLKNIGRALRSATVVVARPLNRLNEQMLSHHLKQLESRATVEILPRGKTLGENELTRSELADTLLEHLC